MAMPTPKLEILKNERIYEMLNNILITQEIGDAPRFLLAAAEKTNLSRFFIPFPHR
jgi:hypothetical protein